MKKIYAVVLVLISFSGFAQDYKCFQIGAKNYFVNSNYYLRGIRIDSVVTVPDTTIYYPYHTIRTHGTTMPITIDTNGGSWLGKKVMEMADGTFIFDTYWGNPVTIKTQAMPGDSWTFYSDSSSKYYNAYVISTDTMTVLGTLDSIKVVRIDAYDGMSMDFSDPINGYKMRLSKNHGFVQIFDLYMFPYYTGASYYYGTDYYYDHCGSQIFNLINFNIPTKLQVYDFSVGDYFEYSGHDALATDNNVHNIDTVVDKVIVNPANIVYTIRGGKCIEYLGYPSSSATGHYTYTLTATSAPIISFTLMPEEHRSGVLFRYSEKDKRFCFTSTLFEVYSDGVLTFEPLGFYDNYKCGMGRIGTGQSFDGTPTSSSAEWLDMIYAYKNGVGCGTYYPLNVPEIDSQKSIQVFPNPTTSYLHIICPEKITNVIILNQIGQTLFDHKYDAKDVQINVENFTAGIYFIKVNNETVSKFIKQ